VIALLPFMSAVVSWLLTEAVHHRALLTGALAAAVTAVQHAAVRRMTHTGRHTAGALARAALQAAPTVLPVTITRSA
jgi:hypothetical protein